MLQKIYKSLNIRFLFVEFVNLVAQTKTEIMTLQQKMVKKINDFGGLDLIVNFLEKFKLSVKDEDRIYFNNIIDYFSLLFEQEVPVEQHAVTYKEATIKSIEVLSFYNDKKQSKVLSFLIKLIKFKLEAVSNIKGLAS
ncbi:hypothetical protein OBPA_11120 [Polaribacter sp. OB-PA-B3]